MVCDYHMIMKTQVLNILLMLQVCYVFANQCLRKTAKSRDEIEYLLQNRFR